MCTYEQNIRTGAHKLIHSVRMMYELPQGPNWVVVKLDIENAHSSVLRAAVVNQYVANPSLQHMALHAATALAPPTILVYRGEAWGTPAGEGVVQGNAKASQDFNVAIQPDLVQLDLEVSSEGGVARGGQDDVFVVGPSNIVFPAIDRFSVRTFQNCGLRLQRAKCMVLSHDEFPQDTPPDMIRAGTVIDGIFEPGLDVYGCPVGSQKFVRNWLDNKVQKLANIKDKTCDILEKDKQALWNILSLSYSQKMDYWASLCYPSDSFEALTKFDQLVWSYLECATGLTLPLTGANGEDFECPLNLPISSFKDRSIQQHIVRLPISKSGIGLRSVAETSGQAFIGGVEMSLSFFTGEFGVAPALEEVIGRPDLNLHARWGPLIRNGSRTGWEFNNTWNNLKKDAEERATYLNEDLSGTILEAETINAGDKAVDGSTRTKVTQLLESLQYKCVLKGLEEHANQLAKPVKRLHQRDKVSQAWLSALCSPLSSIPTPEFIEAMALVLFVPSPSCSSFVGTMVCGKPLDKHGEVLMCASLPFDSWRTRHNTIQATTESIINDCGVIANPEPYGLFSAHIPATATANGGDLQYTKDKQGLIPDFHITFPAEHGPTSSNLAELKCISAGATWYQSKQKAVDQRAKRIPNEYKIKAKRIDTKYHGNQDGHVGPLEQHLQGFGDINCLVAGQYGEISQDFHELLKRLAMAKSSHVSLMEGRPVSVSEQGLILHHLRRRLSVSI